LLNDLEQYANLKEAFDKLSKEVDCMRIEISLLQEKKQRIKEKGHIIYSKLIKRKKMMRQLSERVAKAATALNLSSAMFSTDTKITMLSSIIHQKSEEKEKLLQLKEQGIIEMERPFYDWYDYVEIPTEMSVWSKEYRI
jgi:hypothetical protein